jgi:outer membrane protein assembly factor BamA
LLNDDPGAASILLEVPVDEGPQSTVSSADWQGNTAVSTSELTKKLLCKPAGIADTSCLGTAIAGTQQIYGSKGYMYAHVKSTATLNPEAHTAAFHLTVDEGPIYRMGKVEFLDLPDRLTELVRRLWEMKQGDVYDAGYVKNFLLKHVKANPSLSGWEAHYVQTINDDTRVVDLSLKFNKME